MKNKIFRFFFIYYYFLILINTTMKCPKCLTNRRKEYFLSEKTGRPVKNCAVCRGLVDDTSKSGKTKGKGKLQSSSEDEYEDYSETQSSQDGDDDSDSDVIECTICNKTFDDESSALKHIKSASHLKKAQAYQQQQ